MKNKYAVCEWSLALNGPGAVRLASSIGFNGIQLGDLGGKNNNYPLNCREIREEYREAVKSTGTVLQSLHLHTLVRDGDLKCDPKSAEGQRGLLSIKNGLSFCTDLNIPAMLVTSFDACLINNEYDFEQTGKMLKEACRMGKEAGVTIVYESVTSAAKLKNMLDYVGKDLKICYDILNPVRFGHGNPAEEIKMLGREVMDHVHVKDAPWNLKGCCLLGTGRGGYEKSMEALRSIGYDGWIISENYYHLPPLGDSGEPVLMARKDLETMSSF